MEKHILNLIVDWAKERNLIEGSDPKSQFCKLASEIGELFEALPTSELCKIEDGIGDSAVVLTILAQQMSINVIAAFDLMNKAYRGGAAPVNAMIASIGRLGDAILKDDRKTVAREIGYSFGCLNQFAMQFGYTLESCAKAAYEEIKDRKGVMFDGAFVKEDDSEYQRILKVIEQTNAEKKAITRKISDFQ